MAAPSPTSEAGSSSSRRDSEAALGCCGSELHCTTRQLTVLMVGRSGGWGRGRGGGGGNDFSFEPNYRSMGRQIRTWAAWTHCAAGVARQIDCCCCCWRKCISVAVAVTGQNIQSHHTWIDAAVLVEAPPSFHWKRLRLRAGLERKLHKVRE